MEAKPKNICCIPSHNRVQFTFTSNVASFMPDGNAFVILDRALIQMLQSALST